MWIINYQHYTLEQCSLGRDCLNKKEILQWCFEVSQVSIKLNLNPLESAAAFTYLGRTIAYNNSKWASLYHNMGKARRRWGMVLKLLQKTGATLRSRSMMYK